MKNKQLLLSTAGSAFLTLVLLSFLGFNNPSPLMQQDNRDQIGTIKIWPGNPSDTPTGWRICDGTPLLKTDYSILYEKIGSFWDKDQGYHADFFRIPDLRGVFLRGADGDERDDDFREPAGNTRLRLYSGTNVPTQSVGSFQKYATRLPEGFRPKTSAYLQGGGRGVEHGVGNNVRFSQGDYTGHPHQIADLPVTYENPYPETRPTNAYVHFIIKVR